MAERYSLCHNFGLLQVGTQHSRVHTKVSTGTWNLTSDTENTTVTCQQLISVTVCCHPGLYLCLGLDLYVVKRGFKKMDSNSWLTLFFFFRMCQAGRRQNFRWEGMCLETPEICKLSTELLWTAVFVPLWTLFFSFFFYFFNIFSVSVFMCQTASTLDKLHRFGSITIKC